jgi:hypothetical protein
MAGESAATTCFFKLGLLSQVHACLDFQIKAIKPFGGQAMQAGAGSGIRRRENEIDKSSSK